MSLLRRRKPKADGPDFKRQFFLEAAEPGRWQPRTDDDVQHLIADGPGNDDAEPRPPLGYTEQPPQRIEDAMAKFEEAVISGALAGPAPLADELRRDRDALEAANDRLVQTIRKYRGILRGLGFTQQGLAAIEQGGYDLTDAARMPQLGGLQPHDHGGELIAPWPKGAS